MAKAGKGGFQARRLGAHARAVMNDRRWALLSLAGRAAWLQMTDVADELPELRGPSVGRVITPDFLARLLAATPSELEAAVADLERLTIVARVDGGIRLKAF
ncbi:hypothetical protein AA103196_2287 [Ameyamaea chiangmaiensis NBRC 103196]|uniref:Uncharacterized protein n=1 Tax=Ameyamaea chiangmaiensis TaxID=442969 RepID=A0A850P5C9_9PROT|nr:hypothetical protein [Ameyamaea chiangmaiensis]MBS4075454.1 hypothetical protein [Ameyamaea chiangmaiensis]NVN39014.1 hypothetical protein [Ameyamaea chiangmaiensis]GBQ69703.1 hypothetical protein AA103196_2287 [Ameyamaea chiangmaiensis NBRC 103196]